jgi:hypothetical protein
MPVVLAIVPLIPLVHVEAPRPCCRRADALIARIAQAVPPAFEGGPKSAGDCDLPH